MTDYYKDTKYPQSSCFCRNDTNGQPFNNLDRKDNDPSNLGINECKSPNGFKHSDTMNISKDKQPALFPPNPRYTILNEDFGLTLAEDFKKCDNTACDNPGYTSAYPRLFDSARGQTLALDRPPYEGSVKSWDIYSDKLKGYGQNYSNYKDIHSGQIQYYVDKELEDPLYKPNFIIRSDVESQVFKTPMDGYWFQYKRKPITVDHREISDYQFDRDQMSFREDIMTGQGNQLNQNNWVWTWKGVN